jgi:hypothetical protein
VIQLVRLHVRLIASRRQQGELDRLEFVSRRFASAAILGDLVAHLLAFVQIAQTGALDGADMNEYVTSTLIRLDESEALLGIEPFYDASSHVVSPNEF